MTGQSREHGRAMLASPEATRTSNVRVAAPLRLYRGPVDVRTWSTTRTPAQRRGARPDVLGNSRTLLREGSRQRSKASSSAEREESSSGQRPARQHCARNQATVKDCIVSRVRCPAGRKPLCNPRHDGDGRFPARGTRHSDCTKRRAANG